MAARSSFFNVEQAKPSTAARAETSAKLIPHGKGAVTI
jgi:hypothetical protein